PGGILDQLFHEQKGHSVRAQLTFGRTFRQLHQIDAIAGYEGKSVRTTGNTSRLYGYDDDVTTNALVDYTTVYPKYRNMALQGRIPQAAGTSWSRDEFASWFANTGFTFRKRYIASASARIDKSNL